MELKRSRRGHLDGRYLPAKRAKAVRASLIEHCGGHPSATESIMIDRAASLAAQLEMLEKRRGAVTERTIGMISQLSGQVTRLIEAFGPSRAPQEPVQTPHQALLARFAAEQVKAALQEALANDAT